MLLDEAQLWSLCPYETHLCHGEVDGLFALCQTHSGGGGVVLRDAGISACAHLFSVDVCDCGRLFCCCFFFSLFYERQRETLKYERPLAVGKQ